MVEKFVFFCLQVVVIGKDEALLIGQEDFGISQCCYMFYILYFFIENKVVVVFLIGLDVKGNKMFEVGVGKFCIVQGLVFVFYWFVVDIVFVIGIVFYFDGQVVFGCFYKDLVENGYMWVLFVVLFVLFGLLLVKFILIGEVYFLIGVVVDIL